MKKDLLDIPANVLTLLGFVLAGKVLSKGGKARGFAFGEHGAAEE